MAIKKDVLEKIYTKDIENCFEDIITRYKNNHHWIINFLYFAQITKYNLLQENPDVNYKKALLESDFLLPDGIALNLIYKKYYNQTLPNLNWTDFIPYFLNKLKNNNIPINLYIFWWLKQYKDKIIEHIATNYNIKILYFQDWYSDFDEQQFNKTIIKNNWINVFLVSKADLFRSYNNIQLLKKYKLLLFNVWGLFDFWCWYEKRAPDFVRKIKLEWLWRLLVKPKKNYKKVLQSLILIKYLLQKQ